MSKRERTTRGWWLWCAPTLPRVAAAGFFGALALFVIISAEHRDASRPGVWGGTPPTPYRFSEAGVIWTVETSSLREHRAVAHWPAEFSPGVAGAPSARPMRDRDFPSWAAWPKRPGEVCYSYARGWPWTAAAVVEPRASAATPRWGRRDVDWTRVKLLPGVVPDWLVLSALMVPVVLLLELAWRGVAAFGRLVERANAAERARQDAARLRRWEERPVCPECAYDLGGLPREGLRCPECGWAYRTGSLEWMSAVRRRD